MGIGPGLVTAIAVAAIVWALRPAPPAGEQRFEINTPPTTDPTSLAISPDGQKIVFVATSEGRAMLWLHRFDSGTSAPLAGTDGAMAPFWSPDSRTVGFFTSTDNQLKRIEIDSGSLQALGTAPGVPAVPGTATARFSSRCLWDKRPSSASLPKAVKRPR